MTNSLQPIILMVNMFDAQSTFTLILAFAVLIAFYWLGGEDRKDSKLAHEVRRERIRTYILIIAFGCFLGLLYQVIQVARTDQSLNVIVSVTYLVVLVASVVTYRGTVDLEVPKKLNLRPKKNKHRKS